MNNIIILNKTPKRVTFTFEFGTRDLPESGTCFLKSGEKAMLPIDCKIILRSFD